jgi:hypothetical protein
MPVHDWTRVLAGVFHDFHNRWIGAIRDHLNDGRLPPNYYALAEQVAEGPQPDVIALESGVGDEQDFASSDAGGTVLAVLDHPPKVKYIEQNEREVYARTAERVAVYHASGDRIVAFIEIVSPGNKHSQFEMNRFVEKLSDALDRGVHLLVVDLHPPGSYDPRGLHAAFWGLRSPDAHGVTNGQPLGLSAYRVGRTPGAYFQPVAVGEPLPDMPIFLTPDHYVNVPLEVTYAESWRGVPERWKRVIE